MDFVGVGLVILGAVWAGAFGFAHFRAVGKAKAAESWPSAIATIRSCEVIEEESSDRDGNSTTWYNPTVCYAYTVGGRSYESSRLRFGNYRRANRKKAEAMLARYAAGGTAPVRYNPERPAECVLETVKPGPVYLVMAVAGLLFIGFGVYWTSMS